MNQSQNNIQNYKTSDLTQVIDQKNSEIIKLNIKVQELEKLKNRMIQELEGFENEFQIVERKFLAKENEQNDKLEILEMEKKNLQSRLEYFQKLYPSANTSHNKIYMTENEKIKEEVLVLKDKLSIYENCYAEMETILLGKNTCMNIISNLDTFAIKFRTNEIIERLKNNLKKRRSSINSNSNSEKLKNALKFNNKLNKMKEEKKENKSVNESYKLMVNDKEICSSECNKLSPL